MSAAPTTSPSVDDGQPLGGGTTGCGARGRIGTFYQSIESNGVTRQFFVSVRSDYDPSIPNALYVGLHGRDYDGSRMRDYLGLETDATARSNEIFVYPDALPRAFGGDVSVGWQNGPIPSSYAGTEDLDLIDAMITWLGQNYCVDTGRVFATGQSWGGDFTNVLLCFRGLVFRAGVSVAANAPYYLPSATDAVSCQRQAPIWIMHGKADRWFSTDVGRLVRDFWVEHNACAQGTDGVTFTGQANDDETFDYQNCAVSTRYSSYTAASGHQIPANWYAEATMAYFRDS